MYRHAQKIRLAVVLALLLNTLAPLTGRAAPLSEAEALRLGLSRPELTDLSQARIDEAEAEALEAAAWTNPTLELARDKTGDARETTWRLAQAFDFSGRRALRQTAASHRIEAAQAENRSLRIERTAQLRRAFYDLLKQQEALRALEIWAARFAVIGDVVDRLARAGEASGYDRRRLAREQQAAAARVAEARAQIERSRARFAALAGQSAGDGVGGRLLPDTPPDLSTLQTRLAQRPDLAALQARAAAADADNAVARRNFPEITLGIGGKRVDNGSGGEKGPLLSVSIPLPVFDRRQAGDRRSAAQAVAARAEYRLAQQNAADELPGLHRQLELLCVAAERYRSTAVAPSADLVRIAEAAYRGGESSLLELLDAYKGALEAENTALDLEGKARELRIELDQLTGTFPQ